MLNLNSIPIPEPAVASRILDDEAVLVHPTRGKVKVLNAVGAEIWKRMDGLLTLQEIVDELVALYPVEREVLEHDAVRFVDNLLVRELISVKNNQINP